MKNLLKIERNRKKDIEFQNLNDLFWSFGKDRKTPVASSDACAVQMNMKQFRLLAECFIAHTQIDDSKDSISQKTQDIIRSWKSSDRGIDALRDSLSEMLEMVAFVKMVEKEYETLDLGKIEKRERGKAPLA